MNSEFRQFGMNLREIIDGFLNHPVSSSSPQTKSGKDETVKSISKAIWGRQVSRTGLPELFAGELAPKKHIRGAHPPAGIDHMRLKTVDVFRIPGMGEFTVPFNGYFEVVRSEPSTKDWKTATVYVNFTDLKLFGEHPDLGGIMVDLNPNVISAGNTFPAREVDGNTVGIVACRINVAARFHIEKLGITLFNKTPIQLKNDDVQGIPTIGEGGQAHVASLPMYKTTDPDGELFGFLEELEYTVLNYAPREEVMHYKSATSINHFRELSGSPQ